MMPDEYEVKYGQLEEVEFVRRDENYIYVTTKSLKNDGQIPIDEFSPKDLKSLKPGSIIKAMIVGSTENKTIIRFSKKEADKKDNWILIRDTYKSATPILVDIISKGEIPPDRFRRDPLPGYWGKYFDFDVFISDYDISRKTLRENEVIVGLKLPAIIVRLMERDKKILASERRYVERENEKKKEEILDRIDIGVIFEGKVLKVALKEKYFLIDIDGLVGRLKFENVSWDRYQNPLEIIKRGDVINVVVVDYNKERQEIWFSIKDIMDDPWEDVDEHYSIDQIVEGKVYRIFDFGVVITLDEKFRALIPNSELTLTRVPQIPSDLVSKDSLIKGKIKEINKETRKIIVSTKELIAERFTIGSVVKGKVVKVERYGAFIELEPGVRGLLKLEDISWSQKYKDARNVIENDSFVEVKILNIDPDKRQMDFGLKQIQTNPWDDIDVKFPVGSRVKGTVVKIIESGAFVNLDENIDAFLHLSKIPVEEGHDWKESIQEGLEVEGRIVQLNKEDQRIQISLLPESVETINHDIHDTAKNVHEEGGGYFSKEIMDELKKKAQENVDRKEGDKKENKPDQKVADTKDEKTEDKNIEETAVIEKDQQDNVLSEEVQEIIPEDDKTDTSEELSEDEKEEEEDVIESNDEGKDMEEDKSDPDTEKSENS